MKPRCDGKNYRTFLCCLDAEHEGQCKPYQPPTVDEWRAMNARVAARCGMCMTVPGEWSIVQHECPECHGSGAVIVDAAR